MRLWAAVLILIALVVGTRYSDYSSNDQDFLRHTASDTMRDFIHHERQHMAMEERLLFPAALNALRPADWAEIALELADRHDPLSPLSVEGRFNTLRRNILKLEEEAEEARHPIGSQN